MKSIYLGIILFLVWQTSFAQKYTTTDIGSRTAFSITAGYSQFSLSGDDLEEITLNENIAPIANPFFGISITNTLNSFIALRHEVSYLKKGARINRSQEETGRHYNSKLNLSYIEFMPISPALHVKGFQLHAGPYIGALIQSTVKKLDKDGNTYTDKHLYGDAKQEADYLQKTDFGYTAGLEYQSPIRFNIGIRFSKGLNDLFENAENNSAQWRIKNKGVLIHLGYML